MVVHLPVEPTASAPALRLRPWQPQDAGALALAHQDPLLRRRLMTFLEDEAAARRWIDAQAAGWAAGIRFAFAVEEPAATEEHTDTVDTAVNVLSGPTTPLLGHIVVREGTGPAEGAAEVGYWTAAGARGRGIAPRALDTVSRWALGPQCPLPLTWIALLHSRSNEASCRVAEKGGYELRTVLPPYPPQFPEEGHLHVRSA
ncbi:Protein N-acetyltransferase, RimJ/RimL family [Actinacidiphila yanglinensis]|uniref:Protein N-acetyltransferase, RimJ/RimL family n=1 Tax=Actinacidiphila yanglinensis TaxID=310779 RepID=A0A1H6DXR5_9ACTN|nr:GNAT family N-acetyltransferase [Actinacidiphila yanglinensis]SEG89989.1 Protein N-acetyltransferase, RimJ/RimL family [Actinacidiphila yanglinensis]